MSRKDEPDRIHPPNEPRSRTTSLFVLVCTALLLATTSSVLTLKGEGAALRSSGLQAGVPSESGWGPLFSGLEARATKAPPLHGLIHPSRSCPL